MSINHRGSRTWAICPPSLQTRYRNPLGELGWTPTSPPLPIQADLSLSPGNGDAWVTVPEMLSELTHRGDCQRAPSSQESDPIVKTVHLDAGSQRHEFMHLEDRPGELGVETGDWSPRPPAHPRQLAIQGQSWARDESQVYSDGPEGLWEDYGE